MQVVSALLAVATGGLRCYLWDYQWNFLVQVVSALLAVANGGKWRSLVLSLGLSIESSGEIR